MTTFRKTVFTAAALLVFGAAASAPAGVFDWVFMQPRPGNYLGTETPKGRWGAEGLDYPTFLEHPEAALADDWFPVCVPS